TDLWVMSPTSYLAALPRVSVRWIQFRRRCAPVSTLGDPPHIVIGHTTECQRVWHNCQTGEENHPRLNLSLPVRVQCVEGATLRRNRSGMARGGSSWPHTSSAWTRGARSAGARSCRSVVAGTE